MTPPRQMKHEKAKDFKKAWKNLIVFSKKYVIWIVVALVLAAGSSALTIVGPDKLKEMTNEITLGLGTGINMRKITSIGATLVVIHALSAAFGYFQGFIMNTVTQKLAKRLRGTLLVK